jgi:predicted permease
VSGIGHCLVGIEQPTAGQYFRAVGIPLQRGRLFGPLDTENSPDVVMVNQALADRLWPGQDPIGKQIVVPWGKFVDGKDVDVTLAFGVIGVVGNDREESPAQPPAPAMYWWYQQHTETEMSFVMRTTAPLGVVAPAVRGAVRGLDAALAVAGLRTMTSVVRATIVRPRTTLEVLGLFAVMALLLAALGLYGVVAYWVSNRVREIGVRVALGAQRSDVVRLVVWQALAPTLAGVVAGLVLATATTRVMASLLYGVSPTDPPTLVALAATLCLVAVVAGAIPGLRAARLDPAVALQAE